MSGEQALCLCNKGGVHLLEVPERCGLPQELGLSGCRHRTYNMACIVCELPVQGCHRARNAHTFEVMLVTLFAAVPYTFLYVGDACIV